ncbi:MAG: ABC transporter ATP-binding protein, partial [Planctomycetota bacterium]
MNNVAIKLENVSKCYKLYDSPEDRLKETFHPFRKKYHRKFYALKDVSLEVKRGEIVGIVGRNGSGKSTLLKIVSGVLLPTSGQVVVNGEVSPLLELGAGFNPEFSGVQNVYFYGTILGFSRQDMDERIDDVLAFADIGQFANQPLKTYSSGMKSRLGFAIATAINPEILIVDEILSIGDVAFRRKSFARMEHLMMSGTTVLFVSHSEQNILQICDRAMIINQGSVILDGGAKNVVKLYIKFIDSGQKYSRSELEDELKKLNLGGRKNENDATQHGEGGQGYIVSKSSYRSSLEKKGAAVEIKNFPVDLSSLNIFDLRSEIVNILSRGEHYRIAIEFKFHKRAEKVVFPLSIKTVQGIEVSGVRH